MAQQSSEEARESARDDVTDRVRWALAETDGVGRRLEETLGEWIEVPNRALAMIPNATRRISTEMPPSPRETCTLLHASRLFTSAVGALILLRKGMVLESTVLLRTMLEIIAQAIVFMRHPDMAAAWLNGKRYSPGKIRGKLANSPEVGGLYGKLSDLAHANPDAVWAHSVPGPDGKGFAISFGGAYQPKNVAFNLALLTDLTLMYLRAFYEEYQEHLSLKAWPVALWVAETANDGLREWMASLPQDWEALSRHVSELGQEPPMPPPEVDPAELDRLLAVLQQEPTVGTYGNDTAGEDSRPS